MVGGLLPSALGNLLFPLPPSFSFSVSVEVEGVVKGDSSSLLGSALGSLLAGLLGNSLASPVGGQLSVTISLGVGW